MYTFLEQAVGDYMTREPKTVARGSTMRELGEMFAKDDFNAYPVIDGRQVIGMISKFDFIACFVFTITHIIPRYDELMTRTTADVMSPDFIYVGPDTKLTRVLELMVNHRIRSLPVIDGDQRLAGMISRADVIRALEDSVSDQGRSHLRPV